MQSWWDRFMRCRQMVNLSHLRPKGWVKISVNGTKVAEDHNMIVQTGLNLLASRIYGDNVVLPNVFHFGTDSASTIISMTGLQGTDLFQEEASVSKENNSLLWEWSGTYVGETVSVGEVGIFNSALAMLARFVPIPAFTIKNGDTLEVSWQIKLGE